MAVSGTKISPAPARVRLGILEAGRNRPAIEERFGGFVQAFHTYLGGDGDRFAFADYPVWRGELPPDPGGCDAWLITGSSAGVLDAEPWIAPLTDFVRAAAQTRPVVGICFGHQLVAHAYGGQVERSTRGWGIGVHTYDVLDTPAWMDPVLPEFSLITSHQDQVTRAPAGAQVLASSAFCPVAMMQLGDNILSIQAHPEATRDYARALYDLRRDIIGEEKVDAAIASLAGPVHDREIRAWLTRFLTR